MFSEYASKFLAQSQSRLSTFAGQGDNDAPSSRPTNSNNDWSSRTARNPNTSFLGRPYLGNPYQPGAASRFGQLGFASRISTAQDAPLFQSAMDEFREEDEEEERDREAADLYALQRSRRVAAASKLAESMGSENEASNASLDQDEHTPLYQGRPFRQGIRSSWNGSRSSPREARERRGVEGHDEHDEDAMVREHSRESSGASKGKMVDIGLDSQMEEHDDDPPASLTGGLDAEDDSPPAFQAFHTRSEPRKFDLQRQSTAESDLGQSAVPPSEDGQAQEAEQHSADPETFTYDSFFAWAYLILMAGLFSTYFLVWLQTSPPTRKDPIGDTIYTTLHASLFMLAADTVVAVGVALLWLAALKSFVRPLISLILLAVPVILLSFSLYPFISSFGGSTHGGSVQDRVMRWASTVPFVAALLWTYCVFRGRHSVRQAMAILEFSSRILTANPALAMMGLLSLISVVVWTWLWLSMFTRLFLAGYFSPRLSRFIIQASSWWLGAWFIFMYLWTISILSEVHRATTAATVSQWYFHRNAVPAPTSGEVVQAAFKHAVTTIFGTICESTLVARLVRVPLLILPSRLSFLLQRVANSFVPTPIAAMTNPLSITYAAIHSQGLATSARGLSQMEFLAPQTPTTTLTPRVFTARDHQSTGLLPYRLAKLLLYATRFVMATAMGFAGWVITAKKLNVDQPNGPGIRGSAYAYVVGIVACFIGYSVMGSMESVLGGIVDAAIICYGSERRMANGGGGYCMEAAQLFGERRRRRSSDYV